MRVDSINRCSANVLHSAIEALESRRLLSAGDVDLSFGTSGQVLAQATAAANNLNLPTFNAIVQQSDGKLIAAGADGNAIIISRLSAREILIRRLPGWVYPTWRSTEAI